MKTFELLTMTTNTIKLAALSLLVLAGLAIAYANGIEPKIGKCVGKFSGLICTP